MKPRRVEKFLSYKNYHQADTGPLFRYGPAGIPDSPEEEVKKDEGADLGSDQCAVAI